MALLDRCVFTPTTGGTADFIVSAAVTGYQTPAQANAVNATTYHYAAESSSKTEWEVGTGTYTSATATLARTTVIFSSNGGAKTNFSAAPNVMISALAEDFPNVTIASGKSLTVNNTLTLTATDGSTLAIGGGGTLGTAAYTASSSYLLAANNLSDVTAATARSNLGLGSIATQAASAVAITGGTIAGLTGFAVRDTTAAFDVTLAATSSATLTAGRTLTLDMGNVAHTIAFGTTANTITFPNAASGTVPLLNLAQSFTAQQTIAPSAANTELLTLTMGTMTASTKGINLTGTWNSAGTTFAAPLFVNITPTAFTNGSKLIDLQISGVTVLGVSHTTSGTSNFDFLNPVPQFTTFSVGKDTTHRVQLTYDGTNNQGVFQTTGNSYPFIFQGSFSAFGSGPAVQIASHVVLSSGAQLGWSSGTVSSSAVSTNDTILSRFGAATLQHGAADAASPVAQTIRVQSVVAGTSNTAGVDWTLKGSLGTGTGAGGKIILQTAPAGATGTAQNALATALTLTAPAVNMQPSVVVGNQALGLNDTDGFLYIPSCAGTPAGTPTTQTGRVPMVYDTTNHKFYIYDGGWKGGTSPGAFT